MCLKYKDILAKMTLEEKARILSGKNTWETVDYPQYGIPSIVLSDGPHGLRRQLGAGDQLGIHASAPATCFPTAATVANSWDEGLCEEIGEALAEEARALGVNVILGPGLNVKRSPLCGRNFEYFSEDPYLSGKMAAAYVRGIQSKGVAACPKHFAANSQELRRMANNSVVDERTLREIYTTGFEIAVKEGRPKMIMTAYNEVNGEYANENQHLLQDILVDEWGFDGCVVSDWGGSNDHALGVKRGSHLEMPGTGRSGMRDLLRALEQGTLTEAELDQRVDELLDLIFSVSQPVDAAGNDAEAGGKPIPSAGHDAKGSVKPYAAGHDTEAGVGPIPSARYEVSTDGKTTEENHGRNESGQGEETKEAAGIETGAEAGAGAKAKAAAAFDIEAHHQLAQKAAEESIVLLRNEGQILPLQPGTRVAVIGDFAQKPRYQGAGSSLVNPTKAPESFLEQVKACPDLTLQGFAQGYRRNRKPDARLVAQARALAKEAEAVLVFAGLDEVSESEGLDRENLKMPKAQSDLIQELATVSDNVVVVLSAGSPIEMPWAPFVRGIVHGYLGGQAGASAMLRVLTGRANPSGRLNETYPVHYEDAPNAAYYPGKERSSEYREGPYVGYRYYATVKKKVLFPFGFGLSYTAFAYQNLTVDNEGASFTLTNTGKSEGAEIAQLYVGRTSETVFRPARELKGFARVTLKPGESRRVRIPFDDKTFRFFDTRTNTWEVESGAYQIMIGSSAAQILLQESINIEGTVAEGGYSREQLPDYFRGTVREIDSAEFGRLYGRALPDGSWSGEIHMNDAVSQLYYGKGIFGKLFCGVLWLLLKLSEWRGKPNLNLLFNYNMPIRGYAKMTGGLITMDMARALTEMANGHRIRGTGHLIRATFIRS